MPRSERQWGVRGALGALVASLIVLPALGAEAAATPSPSGSAVVRGSAVPSASGAPARPPGAARPLDPAEEDGPVPPGHPQMDPDEDEEDTPPANAPRGGMPDMFKPPPDTSEEDPNLPAGTLDIELRDADDKPIPNAPLVLVVLRQSVAKGQSKDNRPIQVDANGHLRIDHLELGSALSYWVKDLVGPATFASQPTQLGPSRGVHVVLHAYPVARDLETAVIVAQGVIYFEVKDDRVQVEEAITFFNFGRTAWVPDNFLVKLPPEFTALTSQMQMSDQGVDSVDKVGARIRGTFGPGRHDLDFRWQLPYDGEKNLELDVNLPPHIAIMRVMAAAGRSTTLDVTGFPEAQRRTDRQGQKILITELQVKRDAPLKSVHVMIRGLLTAGPAKYWASGLATLAVLFGIYLGIERKTRGKAGAKSERAELLKEILELERAHRRGELGPKTYERARRELVDAIAETLEASA